jgi:hypothetical protein
MPYALKRPPPPLTHKEGIVNRLKLVANYVELGDRHSLMSASVGLNALILMMEKAAKESAAI